MKKFWCYSFLLMLGWLGAGAGAKGQDANFSQFFSTPVYFNPAFTGLSTGLKARFSYRNQWPTLPYSFKNYFFSAEAGERNLPGSGGLGIMVNSDNEGLGFIRNLNLGLNLSVRIPMSEYIISQIGIRASMMQKWVNWDEFVFTDQLSEKYGNISPSGFAIPGNDKRIFPDFAVGGLVQFTNQDQRFNGTIGLGIDHLFQPDQGFLGTEKVPLPRKWVLHSDFVITAGQGGSTNAVRGSGDPLKMNPGIIYQLQDNRSNLQAGLNLLKYNVYLGAWYKAAIGADGSSAMALLAGYRYIFADGMSVKFMYSYDLQMAGPANGAGGAHEISLVLEFDNVSLLGGRGGGGFTPGGRPKKFSPMECPSF